jgi:DNA-binding transcriptional MerR regulator
MLNITSRTLRFYEDKGLISSTREFSNRRKYTTEQIELIKKILVLRTLGLNISQIKKIQTGDNDLKQAIIEHKSKIIATIVSKSKEIKLLDEHTAFIEDFGTVTCKSNELKTKGNILYIDNYHCYEYTITPLKQIEYNYPYENVTRYYDERVHMMHSRNNNENKYLFNFWKAGHVEIGDVVLESNKDLVSVGLQQFNNGDMYLMISDITQENKNVTITINGKYLPNSYGVTDFKYKNIVNDGKDYTEIKIDTKNSFGKNKILFLIK